MSCVDRSVQYEPRPTRFCATATSVRLKLYVASIKLKGPRIGSRRHRPFDLIIPGSHSLTYDGVVWILIIFQSHEKSSFTCETVSPLLQSIVAPPDTAEYLSRLSHPELLSFTEFIHAQSILRISHGKYKTDHG